MSGSMMSDNFPDLHHKVRSGPSRLGPPRRPAAQGGARAGKRRRPASPLARSLRLCSGA